MVGVPSSQGCQTCKRRKVKCDEAWPTCKQCRIGKRQCPGPSTTLKFVHNNRHTAGELVETWQTGRVNSHSTPLASAPDEHRILMKEVFTNRGAYSKFRLVDTTRVTVRPSLTTVADRVSARLAVNLARPDGGVAICFEYLPLLPQRLSESTCLRDAVAFFCVAWNFYRNNGRRPDFEDMKEYGKALRSLYSTLQNERTTSVETLTTIVLLERTQNIFGTGLKTNKHTSALRAYVKVKGPPDLDDGLDVAIALDYHAILSSARNVLSRDDFLLQPAWMVALGKCQEIQAANSAGSESFTGPDQAAFTDEMSKWGRWMLTAKNIFDNPYSDDNPERAADFILELLPIKEKLRQLHDKLEQTAIEEGTISIVPHSCDILGEKYEFKSIKLVTTYTIPTTTRLIILNLIYSIGELYGPPDESIFAEYRSLALQTWKLFPLFHSLDSCVSKPASAVFYLAYRAAVNDAERNLSWQFLRHVDRQDGKEERTDQELHDFATQVACGLIGNGPRISLV